MKFILGMDCLSNGGRIKCGKPSASLCWISLLNGPLPNSKDLGIELMGGVGLATGGMMGTGQPGIRGEERVLDDVGLTSSSLEGCKNGLSVRKSDSCS